MILQISRFTSLVTMDTFTCTSMIVSGTQSAEGNDDWASNSTVVGEGANAPATEFGDAEPNSNVC